MLVRARRRGIDVVRGVAEHLPFADGAFDTALVVTTICFVDDVPRTLREAERVLAPDGSLVVGYIDRDSPVGEIYQENKAENPFYRDAVFVSTDELREALEDAGFTEFEFVQTVYEWPGDLDEPEPVKSGYGEGSFVGIRASR
jgi:SAM-dependent methyltransferase